MRTLGEIAATISATERRAMKAERETFDRLLAHFLADRVGATFEGHISGVTRAGLFVKLDDTGADGFIPGAHDRGGVFPLSRGSPRPGRRSRPETTHRLGDPVTVRLVEAAPVAGALRFELLSKARPQTPRRGKAGDGAAKNRNPRNAPARIARNLTAARASTPGGTDQQQRNS